MAVPGWLSRLPESFRRFLLVYTVYCAVCGLQYNGGAGDLEAAALLRKIAGLLAGAGIIWAIVEKLYVWIAVIAALYILAPIPGNALAMLFSRIRRGRRTR